VLRDRYLVNSDRHALEIVYLGRALSAPQRTAVDGFYAKLTPEQQQAYSQKADLEFALMWRSEPPNAKVAGQIKWALRTQQMEKDYPGQVAREEDKKKIQAKAKVSQPKQTQQSAPISEPKRFFDGQYAEQFYKALWNQGNTEHNLFKLAAGSVGGSIASGYNGITGLADKGAQASAHLFVQGEQQGGVGGFAKQVAGGAAGMVFSLATEDTLPQTGMTVATMGTFGVGGALGSAAQAGKLGVASVPVLRTMQAMQVGGAFMSGTSIGQGISGKDMWTGEDLSPGQRAFNLTFGAASAALDLGGAGLTTKNFSQSMPTVSRLLEGISSPNATLQGERLGNQAGAVRLGGDGETIQPKVSEEIIVPKTQAGASAGDLLTQRTSFWEDWITKCFPGRNWENTTFETLGKDYNAFKSANPVLDNEMRAMYSSTTFADRFLPSVVKSGSTNPVKITARQGEKFYKLVQKGGNINSPSPYYLSELEYNAIKKNPSQLEQKLGLPLSSTSAEYDVFAITSKTNNNQLFQSTVAPTNQFANATPNLVYETPGGAKQSLIINNGDPDYWDKSINPIETLIPSELPKIGKQQ
jgi:hypothetical protein